MEVDFGPMYGAVPTTPTPEFIAQAVMKAEPEAETGVPPTGDVGGGSAGSSTGIPPVSVKQEVSSDVPMYPVYDPNNDSGPPAHPEVKQAFTLEWWRAAQLVTRDGSQVAFRGNGAFLHDIDVWLDLIGSSHNETGGYLVPWSIIQLFCKLSPSVSKFLTGSIASTWDDHTSHVLMHKDTRFEESFDKQKGVLSCAAIFADDCFTPYL